MRVGAELPTMSNGAKPRQRSQQLKTQMAQAAAGRLLLEHPNGLYRGEITKRLGLNTRTWQSIKKHPMFKKHPDNANQTKGKTRWIVDRKMFVEEYGVTDTKLTHEQRAGHIVNARKMKKADEEKPATEAALADMIVATPPYGSPPFKMPRRVILSVNGVSIRMDIDGSVSFTISS